MPTITRRPNYTNEFFSPIDVGVGGFNPMVTLCRLNFEKYSTAPHKLPMFKELVASSNCVQENVIERRLRDLHDEILRFKGTLAGRVIYPTAFVFHESRVGSTLVANLLGSDPFNMVYSESAPPSSVLVHTIGSGSAKHIALFRDVLTLMGRSPIHKRLFFKFQSITTTKINIALEVLSWIFAESNYWSLLTYTLCVILRHFPTCHGYSYIETQCRQWCPTWIPGQRVLLVYGPRDHHHQRFFITRSASN